MQNFAEPDKSQRALARLREKVEIHDHLVFNADGQPKEILLFQCGVTDADMECFRYFPTFEWIHLGACPITDVGMAHLSQMRRLHFLDLWDDDRITDAGLIHLHELQSLRTLNLWGCSITDAGLQRWRVSEALNK